jgi:hypothetical protein
MGEMFPAFFGPDGHCTGRDGTGQRESRKEKEKVRQKDTG